MYKLLIGIEHLSTGVEFDGWGNISFHRESRTMFWACSFNRFKAYWFMDGKKLTLEAYFDDVHHLPLPTTTTEVKRVLAEYGINA